MLNRTYLSGRLKLSLLIVLLPIFTLSLQSAYADQQNQIAVADLKAEEAFSSILQADKAGADITELSTNFNSLLETLNKAKNNMEDLQDQAISQSFDEIIQQATRLREKAVQEAGLRATITWILVPTTSMIVTLGYYLLVKWYHRFKIKRILEMEVRPK